MKILAVDYGDARTGVATCDSLEMLATPLTTIYGKDPKDVAKQIIELAQLNGAKMLVVGLPRNMDGSEGARARICREFAERLERHSGIETQLYDERNSTIEAARYLNETDTRGKKRKEVIDAAAAAVILQSFLDYRKNNK